MFNWLKKLINKFTHKKKTKYVYKDTDLVYPYVDTKTINNNPNINEYNLARIYSAENFVNKKIHNSSKHKSLKKYSDQNTLLSWIAIVSDVKRPTNTGSNPILLLEKLQLFKTVKHSI